MGRRKDAEAPWIGSSHRFVVVISGSKRDPANRGTVWRGFVIYTPPALDSSVAAERRVGFSKLDDLPVILRRLVATAAGVAIDPSGGDG